VASSCATLTFDLESAVRVTCDVGYSVPILVFPGLSILDLGQTNARNVRRQTKASLNAPAIRGRGITNEPIRCTNPKTQSRHGFSKMGQLLQVQFHLDFIII